MVVEPFVKFFAIRMEDGKKRLICPFQLEADFASQVGAYGEHQVNSKNQSQKIMPVQQIADVKC